MQEIHLRAEIPAAPEAVWEVIADHRGYVGWTRIKEAVLRNPGYPPPNGLGATRVFRAAGIVVEEEITAFEPPSRMEYRVAGGVPVREHLGEMRLVPTASGTRVEWDVRFRPLIPGTGALLRWVFERALGEMLEGLAAYPFASRQPVTGASSG